MMPGGGHDSPLKDSCLENPVDQGAWRAIVHRVTQSQTQLKWLSMHTSEWWLLLWRRKLIGKMHRKLSRVMTIFPVANVCQNPSSHHKRVDYFTACHYILIKRYVLKPFKLRYPVQLITNVYWVFILNSLTWVLSMTPVTIAYWTLAQRFL